MSEDVEMEQQCLGGGDEMGRRDEDERRLRG